MCILASRICTAVRTIRSPHDQIKEQLRLTIEKIKERQERELVNNKEYGLLSVSRPAGA
jgi:hypothetical protein